MDDRTIEVTLMPSGRKAHVAPGTSLYDAARSAGLPVGSSCQADGICGRCGLRILLGREQLSPESADEERVKAANDVDADQRLSCQGAVLGEVTATADYW